MVPSGFGMELRFGGLSAVCMQGSEQNFVGVIWVTGNDAADTAGL